MRRKVFTLLTALLLPTGAFALDETAGTRVNLYLGAGAINPEDGSSDSGPSLGIRLEQFRPGLKIGGSIDAKGIYTGSGDGHSGGYGQIALYRALFGDAPDGLFVGFAFGYIGYEWQDRKFYVNGKESKADWGGVTGAFAAPAVRLNAFNNSLSIRAQYYLFTHGEQKLQYKFYSFGDTYITPSADFKGFSIDVSASRNFGNKFLGLNVNYTNVEFDDANETVKQDKIHLDSVRVSSWSIGITAGVRF